MSFVARNEQPDAVLKGLLLGALFGHGRDRRRCPLSGGTAEVVARLVAIIEGWLASLIASR
jgi:hypothetical protein